MRPLAYHALASLIDKWRLHSLTPGHSLRDDAEMRWPWSNGTFEITDELGKEVDSNILHHTTTSPPHQQQAAAAAAATLLPCPALLQIPSLVFPASPLYPPRRPKKTKMRKKLAQYACVCQAEKGTGWKPSPEDSRLPRPSSIPPCMTVSSLV